LPALEARTRAPTADSAIRFACQPAGATESVRETSLGPRRFPKRGPHGSVHRNRGFAANGEHRLGLFGAQAITGVGDSPLNLRIVQAASFPTPAAWRDASIESRR